MIATETVSWRPGGRVESRLAAETQKKTDTAAESTTRTADYFSHTREEEGSPTTPVAATTSTNAPAAASPRTPRRQLEVQREAVLDAREGKPSGGNDSLPRRALDAEAPEGLEMRRRPRQAGARIAGPREWIHQGVGPTDPANGSAAGTSPARHRRRGAFIKEERLVRVRPHRPCAACGARPNCSGVVARAHVGLGDVLAGDERGSALESRFAAAALAKLSGRKALDDAPAGMFVAVKSDKADAQTTPGPRPRRRAIKRARSSTSPAASLHPRRRGRRAGDRRR